MIAKLLLISALVTHLTRATADPAQHRLKDWYEAAWFDGMVKIPLTIDNSLWVADLYITDSDGVVYDGGYCVIDNNSGSTVIYGTEVT